MPAALIAVAVLGFPTLFVIYLRESDAVRDLPARMIVLAAVLGAALGVGWALLTGASVARSHSVALGAGMAGARMMRDGLGIPLAGAILMLVPVLVVRLLGPPTREALDGFMIGALGALMFTGAATLTRLVPQLQTGVVSSNPMSSYLVEAGIRGITMPLIAAAFGGLIGAALWFTRPESKRDHHPGVVRAVLVSFAAAVFLVYVALGMVDVLRLRQWLMLALYLVLAVVAVMLLRVGLHLAMLHEAHDEIAAGEPLLCPHCGHIVPDMAFCPVCGVATRASSRTSRALRRNVRPQPVDPERGQP
jgi:heme/copper-type cytochrome/quinol oxidase subunit 4